MDFTAYAPFAAPPPSRDGKPNAPPAMPRMEDHFDAILYLGPLAKMTRSRMSPALCADSEYMKMRLGRMALFDHSKAGPSNQLKQYCASVGK